MNTLQKRVADYHQNKLKSSPAYATRKYLELCIRARESGYRVAFTSDPQWLLHMAINRRAGWPDDPSYSRGSCMPVQGKYPKKAEGSAFMELWRIAHTINNTRVALHFQSCPSLLKLRIPWRIFEVREDFT